MRLDKVQHARGVEEARADLVPVSPYWKTLLVQLGFHCDDSACPRCNCIAKDGNSASFPFAPKWLSQVVEPLEEVLTDNPDGQGHDVDRWFGLTNGVGRPGTFRNTPGFKAMVRLRRMPRDSRKTRIAELRALWFLTRDARQYIAVLTQ